MTGKVVFSPAVAHRCFFLFPVEAGLMCTAGTRWQCDKCRAVWELISGNGWQVVIGRLGGVTP